MLKDIIRADINDSLNSAFDDVRKAFASINYQPVNKQPVTSHVRFPHSPIGKVSGILFIIFGSIGMGLFGISSFVLTVISSLISGMLTVTPLIATFFSVFAVSVILFLRGLNLRKRFKRYRMYLTLLKGRSTCMIKELALYSILSEKFVIKDFRKMISKGNFPQAHIDDEKTMIMLNHEIYEQYLLLQADFKARQAAEKLEAAERRKVKVTPEMSRIQITVDEGRKYIQQMNEAKTSITDPEVSTKVQSLADTISRIISYVETHPEKLPEVRRFMAYYLPTTIKLLESYQEFDRHPIQGTNITKAKSEIKGALNTINSAFETLFDSLFENAAWDVSTDISVMKTIFAQEGLTKNDFK